MKIFILEDDWTRMAAFREAFVGHEIVHAKTVQEGIKLWEQKPFDVVLLDHDLEMLGTVEAYFNAENGADFVHFLCDPIGFEDMREALFVVHSWNPDGAIHMETMLKNRYKHVRGDPFGPRMIHKVVEYIECQPKSTASASSIESPQDG